MQKYILKTLGCKANLADSQGIEAELQEKGWMPTSDDSEAVGLCIVNSCTVTDEADKQSRKLAAKLAKENPGAVVVMTGCGAEVNPSKFAASPGVKYVVGNQNKDKLVELITSDILHQQNSSSNEKSVLGTTTDYKVLLSKHPMDREWPAVASFQEMRSSLQTGFSSRTRTFLKIQEGCNSFCTYCIIPYGRGPSRSIRPDELIRQIQKLVNEGVREVILTGTNIGEYGADWGGPAELDSLVERILSETSLERLRVSSLDPVEMTPKLFALMESTPRFCPHFHVSLQSPHSRILRLMKRKYNFDDVRECFAKIDSLSARLGLPGGVFVGMDIITGFPGETEEEFEWTYKTLESLAWTRLHVFPYSEREGTPATRLPGVVPQHVRVQRAKRLTKLSMDRTTQIHRDILTQCNKSGLSLVSILVEKCDSESWSSGYTPNYIRVMFPKGSPVSQNDVVSAKPVDLMIDSRNSDVALVGTQP